MNANKIIAKQVPPEYQESPLYICGEEAFEGLEVYGNRYLNRHTSDLFDSLLIILDDLAEDWQYLQDGKPEYTSWGNMRDALERFAPREDGRRYTRAERLQWVDLLHRWRHTDEEATIFCEVLELITGTARKFAMLRGCCQDDWQYIIYPAKWTHETLNAFEVEYFNLGTEWEIQEGEDEDNTYYLYCTSYDPRAEIAEIVGTEPENIILYEFDGWEHTPKYKEVQA